MPSASVIFEELVWLFQFLQLAVSPLMNHARFRPDIAVTSPEGETMLLIEVKRNLKPDYKEGLAQLRAYHQVLEKDVYLMLVNVSHYWLWNSSVEEPIHDGESAVLLANYIDLQKVPLAQLESQGLTSLVYSWLGSVIFKPAATLLTMPAQKWLVESGLHEHIYRGYIHQEKALV
jgi:hypothetical protein